MTCDGCKDWVTQGAALESERLGVRPRCTSCLIAYYEERAKQLRASLRDKPDRSDYFRERYQKRRASGLCKRCDNPSGKFVLCIFCRAGMSAERVKEVSA